MRQTHGGGIVAGNGIKGLRRPIGANYVLVEASALVQHRLGIDCAFAWDADFEKQGFALTPD